MATNQLPVSRLIKVDVNLAPSAAQVQNLSTLLVLATSVVDTVERMRVYDSYDDVVSEFGSPVSSPIAAAAQLWFSQSPQPRELLVGRWAQTSTNGKLVCAPLTTSQQALANFTGITTGTLTLTKDGGAVTNVTGINLSTALNLNNVAALLQTAITAVTAGVTVTWVASQSRFEITSTTAGAASSISFLTGTVASALGGLSSSSGAYLVQGVVAETIAAALADFDDRFGQQWYGLAVPGISTTDGLSAAATIEALGNKHFYFHTTQEAGALSAVTTTDFLYQAEALGFKRTYGQYSSYHASAAVSAAARIMTTNYNGANTVITLMYKQMPGVQAETLTSTQMSSLKAKAGNVFVEYNNDTAILENGVTASGSFVDEVMGTDWLSLTIQNEWFNLLYQSFTKVPQTDEGTHLLVTLAEKVLGQGVTNGLIAPGVWNSGGFGILKQGDFLPKGFYVYAPRVSTQLQADREARKSVPVQIAVKLAGAIHTVDCLINVNR